MLLKAENIFKPGAFPKYTYVSRNYENTGISYELRLKQALQEINEDILEKAY